MDFILNKINISPTTVMISIWFAILIICSFYEDELWTLSNNTLSWLSFGCVAFFFGGICGRVLVTLLANKHFKFIPVGRIPRIIIVPVYIIAFILFYFMIQAGAKEDDNWYVGVRKIINYGDPDWSFLIFGYIYYIIFPVLYLSAVTFYSKLDCKDNKSTFRFHLVMCITYALMSTAKLKLLLAIAPVFFIRSYFIPINIKAIIAILFVFLTAFISSLILLNKIPNGASMFSSMLTIIGNYTFFNVFAIDFLDFNIIFKGGCTGTDNMCSIMPFFEYGDFRTNIYTIMYSFAEYGMIAYILFQFFIGFIHNAMDSIARYSHNVFAILFSSVLYVPLVFQVMDDQYTASKYILYIMTISYVIYFFKSRKLCFFK
ncbi:O-antigen polymerase [Aeromonas sanarellii]